MGKILTSYEDQNKTKSQQLRRQRFMERLQPLMETEQDHNQFWKYCKLLTT